MKRIFICAMVFFLFYSQAWADDPVGQQTQTRLSAELKQLVDMGVPETVANKMQSRFEASQMVQVRNILQTAKAQGLPIEPLADKALEGIAKNVPADRIVQAMEQVQSRYAAAMADAQEITPTQARQRSLTRTMAQAMSAGMQPEEIEAIADRLQTRKRTMTRDECDQLAETTFTAARDMVRMGASGEVVADTINTAIEEGYTAGQMQRIRSQFMHQAQQVDAEMVANRFRERVRAGQDVADDSDMDAGSGAGQGKDDAGSGSGSGSGSGYGNSGAQNGGNGGSTNGSGNSDGSGNSNGNGGTSDGAGDGAGSGSGSGSNSDAGSGNGAGTSNSSDAGGSGSGGGSNSGSSGNSTGSGSSGTSGSSSGSDGASSGGGSSSGSGSGSSGSGGSGSGGGKK